jgi:hypothetical protein
MENPSAKYECRQASRRSEVREMFADYIGIAFSHDPDSPAMPARSTVFSREPLEETCDAASRQIAIPPKSA